MIEIEATDPRTIEIGGGSQNTVEKNYGTVSRIQSENGEHLNERQNRRM